MCTENSTELLEISGHDGDQDKPWAATGKITGPESVVIDLSSVGLGAAVEGKWTGTGMVWTDGGEVIEGNGVDSWVKVAYMTPSTMFCQVLHMTLKWRSSVYAPRAADATS